MSNPTPDPVIRIAAARSRRAFLTMGLGVASGYGAWTWLRSRAEQDNLAWPVRSILQKNESVAAAYFSNNHLAKTFKPSEVDESRINGDVGLGAGFDPQAWELGVQGLNGTQVGKIKMAQIRELPRVEQITQLNCIEGWTTVVQWAGVRFSDFTAKYAPESRDAKYVGMLTPDESYFVGLDAASAMHPQTLLCYEMNGEPLTGAHGAPLRLVIPVKYGVKNIKRIGRIVYASDRPADYWAQEGYDWYAGL
jgi:hypothetical protein